MNRQSRILKFFRIAATLLVLLGATMTFTACDDSGGPIIVSSPPPPSWP